MPHVAGHAQTDEPTGEYAAVGMCQAAGNR